MDSKTLTKKQVGRRRAPLAIAYSIARQRRFDIVAFNVPDHKSILYRRHLDQAALLRAVEQATDRGANVISIRLVKVRPPNRIAPRRKVDMG